MSTSMFGRIRSSLKELKNVTFAENIVFLVLSLIICICEAFAYVWSGAYGELSALGTGNALFIIFQLVFAGIIVIMLDEMM
jgi:preprotein translocase subunit SecY